MPRERAVCTGDTLHAAVLLDRRSARAPEHTPSQTLALQDVCARLRQRKRLLGRVALTCGCRLFAGASPKQGELFLPLGRLRHAREAVKQWQL